MPNVASHGITQLNYRLASWSAHESHRIVVLEVVKNQVQTYEGVPPEPLARIFR